MEVPNPTTQINVYLTFNDNCEEAMNYYKSILGGEFKMKSTFADGPMEVPEDKKDKIMHIEYHFDGCQILASDSMGEGPCTMGTNFHISVFLPEKERAKETFQKLAEGGQVYMKFEEAFWGGSFGNLVDKFGVQWMISCP